jgi:hypothetical protein
VIRARGHGWGLPLALTALLGGGSARGDSAVELEGRVLDRQGRPLPGADVVVADLHGRLRRAAVADGDGRFVLRLPDAGVRRISFYTERGARVTSLLSPLRPGTRLWLEASDGGADTRVTVLDSDDVLPGGAIPQLARDRDLRTGLVAVPGSAAPATPADGPVVLGTDPAQTQLRLDGFLLNDPVDAQAPWELPAGLFAAVTPSFGLGDTSSRDPGLAQVSLVSRRAERALEGALNLGGGFAAPAGEAQGPERPAGWSRGGFAEASVGAVRGGGRLRGHLALAPARIPFAADPESVTATRGRRASSFPWLARADAEAGGWELGLVGLGSFDRWSYGRAARILPPRDPGSRARDLFLVGTTARRPAATGPGELRFQAGLLRSATRTELSDGPTSPTSRTIGSRLSLAGHLSDQGNLYGWHLFGLAAGADIAWARRPGREPSRQAGITVVDARASSGTPWVAFDERYRPAPSIELDLGLRLEKSFFAGRAAVEGAPAADRTFSTGLLIAPRAQACYRPGAASVCLTAGRFGAGLPLHPMLDTTAPPPGTRSAPADDAALAIGRWNLAPVAFSLFALHRQTAHVIEDRFSPVNGNLELHGPRGARRRMQALAASAVFQGARTRAGAGVLLARLSGNHVGYLDAGAGPVRPGATAEWDGLDSPVNRDGPLPFDRPFSARLTFEHARPMGGVELRLLALGRWDAGTPLSALGRSPVSGIGQVFLVQRGSLGRTAALPGLDLLLQVSRAFGTAQVWLALEGFNVTNQRPVVARDQIYTDLAAAPRAGASGREALGQVVDGAGSPLVARPTFGNPIAWAEPLLLRLRLGMAF